MRLKATIILFVFIFSKVNAQNNQQVYITGHLINFNTRTTIVDFSELADLRLPDNERELVPDKNGYFSIRFALKQPNYFLLGRNVMYLSPGDKLSVTIDYKEPLKSEFHGSARVANNYLRSTPLPKAGSYLDGGFNLKKTIKENIDNILLLAQERRDTLSSTKLLSKDFIVFEKARIDADIINSFKFLPGIFIYKNKIPQENQLKIFGEVDSLTGQYLNKYCRSLINASFLKIESFRKNSYRILDSVKDNNSDVSKIKDWQYAHELFRQINSIEDKQKLLKLKGKIDTIKDSNYRNAIKETFNLKSQFWNGDAAKDFIAYDINSNEVKLSSLKGKIIFIDLWATWCGPCLEEMPFFENIKKKYADNPNISFVALCVNDNRIEWKENLKKRNSQGLQLFAEQSQMLPYKILSLPRTIIIDKDFKIIKMSGPLPSYPATEKYIESLLTGIK
ncbi:TlpA family protein disulfide reductase [Mucilaginibacter arboris]|nr:TlpA disulfide reductase family protein [Mucilaginibacter arboris]